MRHRGAEVGSFFLADKADGEAFTGRDEEALTLFASQAAAAIANARTHRDERRARTELLSLVGHELRTPLAAIKGSVATLLDASRTVDPAELREFLRVIDEQANHMRGLIGDLLDARRIDAGALSVAPEPPEVGDLVERARTAFLGGGGRHGIAVDLPAGPQAAPQPGEPVRILAVDDDPRMLRLVRDALAAAGYAPLVTGEPEQLAAIIRAESPRLVLLDLVLPGRDGIELMQQLPELSDLPVIFISAYGRAETVARALEAGAADYVVKPFSPTELMARVRAALRRHEGPQPFVLGALAIDYGRRRVTVAGRPVPLTATEYELLRVLSLDAGRVVTYDTLLRRVWRGSSKTASSPVRAFVRSLRRKLGDDAANPAWIFNERGVGYRVPRPGDRWRPDASY